MIPIIFSLARLYSSNIADLQWLVCIYSHRDWKVNAYGNVTGWHIIEFGGTKSLFTFTILLFTIAFILGHWGLKQCMLLFHHPLSSFPTTVHLVRMSPCYTLNNDGNFDSQKLSVSFESVRISLFSVMFMLFSL